MVQVCFTGAPGSGVQVAGRTYAPGETAVFPIPIAAGLVADGRAYIVPDVSAERVAVPDVEHRDSVGKGRRR